MKVRHETRSRRKRRRQLLRAGIWIFLCIFAFSVVGGLMILITTTPGSTPAAP